MANTQISPYEQARLDKIKRNEERLRSLGLLDAKKHLRQSMKKKRTPSTPKRTIRKARTITPSPPSRSSRRLKRKPVQYEPLMDDDIDLRMARKRFKEVKKKTRTTVANTNFKCDIPEGLLSSPLTEKQKATIKKKMEDDFLGKFEVSLRYEM